MTIAKRLLPLALGLLLASPAAALITLDLDQGDTDAGVTTEIGGASGSAQDQQKKIGAEQ